MKDIKKKKIIELPVSAIKFLDQSAKADGRSTKNFIERIVMGHVLDNTPPQPINKPKSK